MGLLHKCKTQGWLGGVVASTISIRRGSFAASRNDFCEAKGAKRLSPRTAPKALRSKGKFALGKFSRYATADGSNRRFEARHRAVLSECEAFDGRRQGSEATKPEDSATRTRRAVPARRESEGAGEVKGAQSADNEC